MAPEIALSWQLGPNFGWGLFGLQIALQLAMMGRAQPILLSQMLPFLGDPEVRARLDELWAYNRGPVGRMQSNRKAGTTVPVQVPVITALGNNAERQFVYPRFVYRGTRNHGLVFLENPLISARAL
jgi:hypothetical protein